MFPSHAAACPESRLIPSYLDDTGFRNSSDQSGCLRGRGGFLGSPSPGAGPVLPGVGALPRREPGGPRGGAPERCGGRTGAAPAYHGRGKRAGTANRGLGSLPRDWPKFVGAVPRGRAERSGANGEGARGRGRVSAARLPQ